MIAGPERRLMAKRGMMAVGAVSSILTSGSLQIGNSTTIDSRDDDDSIGLITWSKTQRVV